MIGRARTPHLLIMATAVISLAAAASAQGTCNLLGEVFVTNPFDQALMIKGDGSAHIDSIRFSNQTQFVRVTVGREPAGKYDPQNLQVGDRVCVSFDTAQATPASRILVMKRSDIQEHQKLVFAALARNSAFGVVTALNNENRTIRLNEALGGGASQPVIVETTDRVAFRQYSPEAQVSKEGVASSWARLKVGDQIYVQGRRDAASPAIRADAIIVGGIREIFGTIASMNGVGYVIEMHELGSGHSMIVRIRRDAVFRSSPFLESAIAREATGGSASWDLQTISFSDLEKGDTIGVLARETEGAQQQGGALMVVTGFGSYGTNELSAGKPMFWFLDPLKAVH